MNKGVNDQESAILTSAPPYSTRAITQGRDPDSTAKWSGVFL